MIPSRLLAAALLALAANGAWAQYVWVDEKGARQFSDRPPPPSVPARNILKQPSASSPTADLPAAASTPAAPTLAEREADFRKRAQEKAVRDGKAAEAARERADRQQRCAAARAYLAQLASPERIGLRTADGGRRVLDDQERAREAAAARRILAACR